MDEAPERGIVKDPIVIPNIDLVPLVDDPKSSLFTGFKTFGDALLGSRSSSYRVIIPISVLGSQNFCPKRVRLIYSSLGQGSMQSFVFIWCSLNSQSTKFFGSSDHFPAQQVHFLFYLSSSPNEISMDSVNLPKDHIGEGDVLYYMIRNVIKRDSSQSSSTSNIEKIYLPIDKLSVHAVKDELKIPINWGFVKNWEAKVLPKAVSRMDVENGGHIVDKVNGAVI